MSDEIHEIIRVLQLTTYDEEEWDADDITVMKKAQVCEATGDLVWFQISFRMFMYICSGIFNNLHYLIFWLQSGIEQKMKQATDWLQDPAALIGSLGRSKFKICSWNYYVYI